MTIVSKRGKPASQPTPEVKPNEPNVTVYIWHSSSAGYPMTEEELDEINRGFEAIRKSLGISVTP